MRKIRTKCMFEVNLRDSEPHYSNITDIPYPSITLCSLHCHSVAWSLLPAGSEKQYVLQAGSIHVAVLHSCEFLYNSIF